MSESINLADAPLGLRHATREDLPAILALMADDILGATRELVPIPDAPVPDALIPDGTTPDIPVPDIPVPDVYLRAFAAIEAQPGNEFLVLVRGEVIIGCLQLTIIPGLGRQGRIRAQVETVRIARALRGQGLGTVLFQLAIDRARSQGADILQLTTDTRRADARRFYEKLGFEASHVGMKLMVR